MAARPGGGAVLRAGDAALAQLLPYPKQPHALHFSCLAVTEKSWLFGPSGGGGGGARRGEAAATECGC